MNIRCTVISALARSGVALIVAVALSACNLGPKYARPAVETPAAYKESKDWKVAEPRDHAPRGAWWRIYNDAELNVLAEKVSVSNQTLHGAEAQYRRAQAAVAQTRAGLFPIVGANLSATRAGGGSRVEKTTYDVGASATWDTDLWGRIRRNIEAGTASAEAAAADVQSARLLLQSELTLNYLQLRVLDAQKKLLDETAEAFAKSLQLTQNRYKAGLAGRVDVAQAEAQLKSTQAQAIDTGVQRAQLEHAIAVLTGAPPAALGIKPAVIKFNVPIVAEGVPADLLERRPDIAAAERRVAAANAQVGAARVAFFPSLTLGASGLFDSTSFARWLTAPSRVWSLGPDMALALFDAGQRKAVTDQARAAYDASVAAYRQSVLDAMQEVEDQIAALRILEQEARVQDDAVKAARLTMELTNNQYRAGTVSYLNVVTAQTTLLNNERTALAITGRRLTASAQLIRALGGGWSVDGLPKK
jgi:NodT family efflux transporter outer membrane factor (OMF) lipoprotein